MILHPRLLILLLFSSVILLSCDSNEKLKGEPHPKISGAYFALNAISGQRAYPANDIPQSGIYKSFKYAQSNLIDRNKTINQPWETLGPHNTAGRTLNVIFNPQNTNTIYAATASGGLWKSHQMGLGVSWEYVKTGFPVTSVSAVAINPIDTNLMYIGTGEVYNYAGAGTGAAFRNTRGTYGIGILKSVDGGLTWTKSLDWTRLQRRGVNVIKIAEDIPATIFAGTSEGVFRSKDNGETWEHVLEVIMTMDLDIQPNNSDAIIASCGNFGSEGAGLYRTTDGGDNWTKITDPALPVGFQGKGMLDFSKSDPSIVYAAFGDGFLLDEGGTWLVKSKDGGVTWTLENDFDYSKWQGWFAHNVAVNPKNPDRASFVGIEAWVTVNGGSQIIGYSWGGLVSGTPPINGPDSDDPNYIHADIHDVIYHPTNTDTLIYATDGGLFLSVTGGQTFRSINGGLQTTQFYNGFSLAAEGDFAMGGLQDNSTVVYTGSKAWRRAYGGDGSWTALDAVNDSIVYASSQWLDIVVSFDKGNDFDRTRVPITEDEESAFIAPFVASKINTRTLVAGRTRMYKSIDNGYNWDLLNNGEPLNGDPIFAMDISKQFDDVIIAATAPINRRPEIFRTDNAGKDWVNITSNLPDRYITDIAISPNDVQVVYATIGGFGSNHLYKSNNFGESWIPIGVGLPDVPTNAIVIDPFEQGHLYVGNDLGVFFSENDGQTWEQLSVGLPDALIVMDLKIAVDANKIYIASHGNGAYRRDLESTIVSSTQTIPNLLDLNVFPVPAKDFLQFDFELKQKDQLSIQIFNVKGQQIANLENQLTLSPGRHQKNYNLPANLSAGNYLYQFQLGNKRITETFTILP